MRLLAIICALTLAATNVQAAGARWIGTWAAPPAPPMAAPANNPARGTPTFNDQTLIQVVRLSAGGQRLRLRPHKRERAGQSEQTHGDPPRTLSAAFP